MSRAGDVGHPRAAPGRRPRGPQATPADAVVRGRSGHGARRPRWRRVAVLRRQPVPLDDSSVAPRDESGHRDNTAQIRRLSRKAGVLDRRGHKSGSAPASDAASSHGTRAHPSPHGAPALSREETLSSAGASAAVPQRGSACFTASLEDMSVAARPLFAFDDSFVRELEGLYVPWQGAPVRRAAAARAQRGAGRGARRRSRGAASGRRRGRPGRQRRARRRDTGRAGVRRPSVRLVFAAPRRRPGAAARRGLDVHGNRRDLHLKGSGRTPFARGGDGKAVVGPDAARVRDRRGDARARHPDLACARRRRDGRATSLREAVLPGAVLARVAASHIRVGTFQYAAMNGGPDLVRRLADYSIARHHPHAAEAENPYLAFYERVIDAQASLVAQWMLVGFIHGVMNTDNMAISGETIDYGPCAFMDAFDPATVFSSIDHGGRYAYGNQPHVAPWNLARLAEALLPLIDDDKDTAVATATDDAAERSPNASTGTGAPGCGPSSGSTEADDVTGALDRRPADAAARAGRRLHLVRSGRCRHRCAATRPAPLFAEPAASTWAARWREQLAHEASDPRDRRGDGPGQPRLHPAQPPGRGGARGRDRRRPRAVSSAWSTWSPDPFDERPGLESYAAPAPGGLGLVPHLLRHLATGGLLVERRRRLLRREADGFPCCATARRDPTAAFRGRCSSKARLERTAGRRPEQARPAVQTRRALAHGVRLSPLTVLQFARPALWLREPLGSNGHTPAARDPEVERPDLSRG